MEKKEAMKILKDFYDKSALFSIRTALDTVIPELKESEDEKAKRMLHSISSKMSFHLRDIFTEEEFQCFDAWSNAWLEKQGEQKPEWSEEDLAYINSICDIINDSRWNETSKKDFVNWLKSLHPQKQWKPGEGQLECLGYAIEKTEKDWSPMTNNRIHLTLKALKEQLEKL